MEEDWFECGGWTWLQVWSGGDVPEQDVDSPDCSDLVLEDVHLEEAAGLVMVGKVDLILRDVLGHLEEAAGLEKVGKGRLSWQSLQL